MCLISLPLGVIYSKKGRQSSCDIFPLGVYSRQGRVDNMCLISLPLGVIYCRKGRQSSGDIFPLEFGCFFQEGRTSFEASGFLIWVNNRPVPGSYILEKEKKARFSQ